MNKLLLLILLFNIVKATFICKCKSSTNCDDINIALGLELNNM
jgi:hypothetical protein